ncbi:putative ninjurin-1-like [Scophthalmus maximus]|uniref:Putative ninjurin-1-like n=1 Tax=Scophthalmus maximus TaxID=52904 RepID=A0A2U9C1W2_SCOMX|nr:putative ninjurin-1-like [Scophthalmus maximus]
MNDSIGTQRVAPSVVGAKAQVITCRSATPIPLTATPVYIASKAISGKVHRPINMNHYATKKSAAQSMLDVALLMANSSQLKTLLYVGPQYRFYIPLIVLLSLSISLQVAVGLLLVFIVKYDLNDARKHTKLNTMNNISTIFVFFTVLINIFITALGFEGHSVMSSVPQVLTVMEPLLPPKPIDHNITGII